MPWPVNVDATWLDGGASLDGGELRRADAAMFAGGNTGFGARGGIVRHEDSSLLASVDASDNLTLQPGSVVVPGTYTAGTGIWRFGLAAATTNVLSGRNATLGRVDRLVGRVLDTSVRATHAAYTGQFAVLPGIPNATPINGMQALPEMAVDLGRINVPLQGGPAATIDLSFRTFAAALGGVLPVPSSARLPATGLVWDRAVALDTGVEYVWTGTAWVSAPPHWRGSASGLTVAANTSIGFTTVEDTDTAYAGGVLTAKRAGVYNARMTLKSAAAISAGMNLSLFKNGARLHYITGTLPALAAGATICTNAGNDVRLAVGEALAFQADAAFQTPNDGIASSFAAIDWVRP